SSTESPSQKHTVLFVPATAASSSATEPSPRRTSDTLPSSMACAPCSTWTGFPPATRADSTCPVDDPAVTPASLTDTLPATAPPDPEPEPAPAAVPPSCQYVAPPS